VCCRVLQGVAGGCSVVQRVAACCNHALQGAATDAVLQGVAKSEVQGVDKIANPNL